MFSNAHMHMNNAGKSTLADLESIFAVNMLAMQKMTELQFTFVSSHIDNAMEQLKLLSNFDAPYYLMSAESGMTGASGARAAGITRKASMQATLPKDRTTRRKTRKKNS